MLSISWSAEITYIFTVSSISCHIVLGSRRFPRCACQPNMQLKRGLYTYIAQHVVQDIAQHVAQHVVVSRILYQQLAGAYKQGLQGTL